MRLRIYFLAIVYILGKQALTYDEYVIKFGIYIFITRKSRMYAVCTQTIYRLNIAGKERVHIDHIRAQH